MARKVYPSVWNNFYLLWVSKPARVRRQMRMRRQERGGAC